ncbi:hypothetical protein RAM80_07770 [Pseudomonas sp. App30]|uniref:hypothetical protein n=1 Tax=Pseudomonas sp. App30 TaxID=3068990 RepID=UPI003A7F8C8C
MPEIKHTPGPWLIDPVDNEYIVPASEPDSIGIAIVSTIDPMQEKRRWWFGPESLANAKLIAAAPDLLEALQDLVTELGDDWNMLHNYLDRARAAIAKATQ